MGRASREGRAFRAGREDKDHTADPQPPGGAASLGARRAGGLRISARSAVSRTAIVSGHKITVAGRWRRSERTTDAGRTITHHFCPGRGSTVFYAVEMRPGTISIPVTALADPHFPRPVLELYPERSGSWRVQDLQTRDGLSPALLRLRLAASDQPAIMD